MRSPQKVFPLEVYPLSKVSKRDQQKNDVSLDRC